MKLERGAAFCLFSVGVSLLMSACGGGGSTNNNPPPPTTYTLTVNSTNPASGVAIEVTYPPTALATQGTTSFTVSQPAGTTLNLTAPATAGGNTFTSWTGCASTSGTGGAFCSVTLNANTTVTANYAAPVVNTYTLSVNSTNPASGVAIGVSPADNNSAANGNTSFTRTYNSGASVTLTAPSPASGNNFSSWTGCTSTSGTGGEFCSVTLNANTTVTANYAAPVVNTYTLSVNSTNPASGVAIGVSPADNNSAANGNTSFTRTYNSGASVTLTAPSPASGNNFSSWTGCTSTSGTACNVTMSANQVVTAIYIGLVTPTVTVTPGYSSIATTDPLSVTVTLIGGNGDPTPTGSVVLTGGGYTSAATTLSSGSAQIAIPASSLIAGSDTLKATYTPDAASSATYNSASGTSSAVTVIAPSTVTVDLKSSGLAVTDQLLGMNMAVWDDVSLAGAVTPFETAGIKAVRWPGGSTSDDYHWEGTNNDPSTPSMCPTGSYAFPGVTFADFVNNLAIPAGLDIALTADYGSDPSCITGGLPSEAAAWVANALTLGATVSHMTVGNENYGSWEEDLHAKKQDPATYAAAVVGASGFYQSIKAASPNTMVGVVVDADNTTGKWDNTVLANAKGSYDFVEYHYYPEAPGSESDTTLIHSDAQQLTTNINTIRAELTKWGTPDTPIYVGEIGGPYSNPGKQSWSITQGLYAGQVLGEMMNAGISRLTWWIGFGNCNGQSGNDASSLYGWQTFGAYNVFSDGSADSTCQGAGTTGTLSPTAQAFHLFSNVAVNGESVLTATVGGDTTDVVAYAATHSGGTALVLFNRNETTSEPVTITLTGQSAATTVTVETYDKSIYDQTNASIPVWAAPTTTTISSPTLPLSLTLTPWSMNVVIIH
jgi:hypothetical protein